MRYHEEPTDQNKVQPELPLRISVPANEIQFEQGNASEEDHALR